jgi:hypothetical protein
MTHTPGPWKLGEFSETGGYDCMTAGISAGPAQFDGASYGQKTNGTPMTPEEKARMLADARLIAAAPEMLAALEAVLRNEWTVLRADVEDVVRTALAKARGGR